jgi:hypothetical protein
MLMRWRHVTACKASVLEILLDTASSQPRHMLLVLSSYDPPPTAILSAGE